MKKVLFVGGGSIGHIAPSVAIAQTLSKHTDIECHFVCGTNSNEVDFIKKYAFPCATLPHIRRSPIYTFIQSHRILSKKKPDLIFSKGGYVSIPICLVAWAKKIPIILHESDTVMGRANWLISKFATCVCFGFGNPIREEITQGYREKGLKITKFSGQKPILLVLGGSQGANALNEIVWNNLEQLLTIVDIVHITGPGKRATHHRAPFNSYWSTEFAYDELPHLYALANIALSRAGANIIAELEANHIPTILVPLRDVGHDHQYQNAKVMADFNPLFIHMEQEELTAKLISTIKRLLSKAKEASEAKAANEANIKITKVILDHLDEGRRHP